MSQADRETPRSIAVIGIVMLMLTVLGYVALGVIMKMNGYPKSEMIRWTPLALNLRQQGHWLLVLPIAWIMSAVVIFRTDSGAISQLLAYVVGTALLGIVAILFLFAIANPYTRPLLISVEKKSVPTSSPTRNGAPPGSAPSSRN
jgi:hypothetical protein